MRWALLAAALCACSSAPVVRPFTPPPKTTASAARLEDLLAHPTPGLQLYVLSTGQIEVPASAMIDPAHPKARPEDVGGKRFVENLAFLVRHPTAGDFLVDTGLGPQFAERSHGDLGWYTRWSVRTRVSPGHDVATQVRKLGVDPAKLKLVIITHGHIDHTGGLPALGAIDVLLGQGEAAAISRPLSVRKGYKAAHFARARNVLEANLDDAPEVPPLGRAIDLVGDGSLWLVDTRGHTPGHVSVLVNLPGGAALLAGDAVQTPYALDQGIPSGNVTDAARASEVARRMQRLHQEHPDMRFFFGHDQSGVRLAPEHYP